MIFLIHIRKISRKLCSNTRLEFYLNELGIRRQDPAIEIPILFKIRVFTSVLCLLLLRN